MKSILVVTGLHGEIIEAITRFFSQPDFARIVQRQGDGVFTSSIVDLSHLNHIFEIPNEILSDLEAVRSELQESKGKVTEFAKENRRLEEVNNEMKVQLWSLRTKEHKAFEGIANDFERLMQQMRNVLSR